MFHRWGILQQYMWEAHLNTFMINNFMMCMFFFVLLLRSSGICHQRLWELYYGTNHCGYTVWTTVCLKQFLLHILKWKRFKHFSCVHECFIDPFRRVHICCNLEKMKNLIFVILPTFKTENQVKNRFQFSFEWLGIDLVKMYSVMHWYSDDRQH